MPRILLHENPAQPAGCLDSLVQYAHEIERTAFARSFASLDTVIQWIRAQPVKPDQGEPPQRSGCRPTQRARIWPLDGMNCWEATAHFLGVALALQIPEIVHLYDVTRGGSRHVWPELQDALQIKNPVLVELQPVRAQASWNDVADLVHGIGSQVLAAYGMGAVTPLVEKAWTLAPKEYGLTKNKDAPPAPPLDVAAKVAEAAPQFGQALADQFSPEEKQLLDNPQFQSLLRKVAALTPRTEGRPS